MSCSHRETVGLNMIHVRLGCARTSFVQFEIYVSVFLHHANYTRTIQSNTGRLITTRPRSFLDASHDDAAPHLKRILNISSSLDRLRSVPFAIAPLRWIDPHHLNIRGVPSSLGLALGKLRVRAPSLQKGAKGPPLITNMSFFIPQTWA